MLANSYTHFFVYENQIVLVGMGKSNQSLELDTLGKCLIPETVAHSRNRLRIYHPKQEKRYQEKDTSMPTFKEVMKEGVIRGRD